MPRYLLSKKSLAAVVLVFAYLAASCAGNQADSAMELAASNHPVPWSLGPALPFDALKSASLEDADRFCRGADYAAPLPSQRVTPQGTQLIFQPSWDEGGEPSPGDLAYAMYVFSLDGYDDQPELALNWGFAPADWSGSFIGLGNQAHNCWDWFTDEDISDSLLILEDLAPYLDGEGGLVMIVLMTGMDSSALGWLRWGGNVAPVAALEAEPLSGSAPLEVSFNANSSIDPDGALSDFEWDFDGDGEFNEPGPEADARGNAMPYYTYNDPGTYAAAVRVTDNKDAQDTAAQQVSVTVAGWVIVTVDIQEDLRWVGDTSLCVVDGNPAISYSVRDYWDGPMELKYARAMTSTGGDEGDWSQAVTVDSRELSDWPYRDISLVIVDGNPAIGYCDPNQQDGGLGLVKYARATTGTGAQAADWSQIVEIASGDYPSMAAVNGNPALAWRSPSSEITDLAYLRASTPTGGSADDWGEPVILETEC